MASMKVLEEPSGLCCRHMASKADLDAVTHASSGPYRFLTCGVSTCHRLLSRAQSRYLWHNFKHTLGVLRESGLNIVMTSNALQPSLLQKTLDFL